MGKRKHRGLAILLMTVTYLKFFSNINYGQSPQLSEPAEFIINTPGCKIPLPDPYHISVKPFITYYSEPLPCHSERLINQRRNSVDLNPLYSDYLFNCQYTPFRRKNDNYVTFDSTPVPITGDTNIPHEFVMVECIKDDIQIYQDFFPFVVRKPEIENRVLPLLPNLKKSKPLSVLLLGIDSCSKNHYIRHLKKTDAFIRSKLSYIELHGYHKVGLNTFPNMVPFHTGKAEDEYKIKFKSTEANVLPLVWNIFAKSGYRTLFGEDAPNIATFNYAKKGFKGQPTDYYLRPFSIGAEKSNMHKRMKNGCFPGRTEASAIFKWMEDFFDEFPDDPLFAYEFLSRITHDDYNGLGRHDEDLLQLLQRLEFKGHLNRTIVFFFSDHGFRHGDIRMTYVGHTEDNLPFFFFLLPSWFAEEYPKYYKNLKINEERLVTPFDMHATLLDIVSGFTEVKNVDPNSRSVSLFTEISPLRTCRIANINSQYCVCTERQQVPTDDEDVRKSAETLVEFLNSLTKDHEKLCAKFTISAVKEVTSEKLQISKGNSKERYEIVYQVTLEVNPGGGIFQGIVKYDGETEKYTVETDIDRLNLFGNQSHCIDLHKLKPVCYCL